MPRLTPLTKNNHTRHSDNPIKDFFIIFQLFNRRFELHHHFLEFWIRAGVEYFVDREVEQHFVDVHVC